MEIDLTYFLAEACNPYFCQEATGRTLALLGVYGPQAQ